MQSPVAQLVQMVTIPGDGIVVVPLETRLARTCVRVHDGASFAAAAGGPAAPHSLYEWETRPFRVWARFTFSAPDAAYENMGLVDYHRQRLWLGYRDEYCHRLKTRFEADMGAGQIGNRYCALIEGLPEAPADFMAAAPKTRTTAPHATLGNVMCWEFFDLDACIYVAKRLSTYVHRSRVADDTQGETAPERPHLAAVELLDPFGTYTPWGAIGPAGDALYGILQLPPLPLYGKSFVLQDRAVPECRGFNAGGATFFYFPTHVRPSEMVMPAVAVAVAVANRKWLSRKVADEVVANAAKARGQYGYYDAVFETGKMAAAHITRYLHFNTRPTAGGNHPLSTASTVPTATTKPKQRPFVRRACKGDAEDMNKRKRTQTSLLDLFGPTAKRPRLDEGPPRPDQ